MEHSINQTEMPLEELLEEIDGIVGGELDINQLKKEMD